MLVDAKCNKCHETMTFDIGDMTLQEVKANLAKQDTYDCRPGHHVELSSPINYLEFDESTLREGHAQTDEEWLQEQKAKGLDMISTDRLREEYEIDGFSMGFAVGKKKSTGEKVALDWRTAPSGARYYFD